VDNRHKSCELCTGVRKSCTFRGAHEEIVPRSANRARIEGSSKPRGSRVVVKMTMKDEEVEDESDELVQIVERNTLSKITKAGLL
jgi:hypothetical protein